MSEAFRYGYYARHNSRRLEHVASLGLDLQQKSVLEVGAGVGDLTGFFLDRGCAVISVEPRPENCQAFGEFFKGFEYPSSVQSAVVNCDVESVTENIAARFDVVFCYGLLYHVADPELVLRILADRCTGLLLLETRVSFGDEEAINPLEENVESANQSFHGGACRPTRPWVFNRLRALFPYVYMPATQPAHEEFPIDWTAPADAARLTRAVFVGARHRLASPLLLDHVPDRQRRA